MGKHEHRVTDTLGDTEGVPVQLTAAQLAQALILVLRVQEWARDAGEDEHVFAEIDMGPEGMLTDNEGSCFVHIPMPGSPIVTTYAVDPNGHISDTVRS